MLEVYYIEINIERINKDAQGWNSWKGKTYLAIVRPNAEQKKIPISQRIDDAVEHFSLISKRFETEEELSNNQLYRLLGNNAEGSYPEDFKLFGDFRDRAIGIGDIITNTETKKSYIVAGYEGIEEIPFIRMGDCSCPYYRLFNLVSDEKKPYRKSRTLFSYIDAKSNQKVTLIAMRSNSWDDRKTLYYKEKITNLETKKSYYSERGFIGYMYSNLNKIVKLAEIHKKDSTDFKWNRNVLALLKEAVLI